MKALSHMSLKGGGDTLRHTLEPATRSRNRRTPPQTSPQPGPHGAGLSPLNRRNHET